MPERHPLDVELPPAPRPVVALPHILRSRRMLRLLGAFLTLLLLGFAFVERTSLARLRDQGHEATGTLTRLGSVPAGGSRRIEAAWTFEVQGRRYEGAGTLPHAAARDLRTGDPIAIIHSPSDPTVHRPAPVDDALIRAEITPILVTAGILAALLGGLIVFTERRNRRFLGLLRNGATAVATVSEIMRGNILLGSGVIAFYAFDAAPGRPIRGRSRVPGKSPSEWRPGDELTVLFDPADPDRNLPALTALSAAWIDAPDGETGASVPSPN